jgi:hypothetical protein
MEGFLQLMSSDGFHKVVQQYVSCINASIAGSVSAVNALEQHDDGACSCKDDMFRYFTGYSAAAAAPVPGEYYRDPLIIETLHNAVVYGAAKGFTIYEIVKLIQAILNGLDMINSEDILKEISINLSAAVSKRAFMLSVEYLYTTIVQHISLYRYVMNTEQELDQREEAFTVTAGPVDMSDLQEGHVEDEWIRLQKLNSVKDEYEQTKLDSTLLREDILKENKEKLSKTCDALLQKYKVVSMVTEDQVQADVQALVKVCKMISIVIVGSLLTGAPDYCEKCSFV